MDYRTPHKKSPADLSKLAEIDSEIENHSAPKELYTLSREELIEQILVRDEAINVLLEHGKTVISTPEGLTELDLFKQSFYHSPVPKAITTLTGEINVNPAFCAMLGYSYAELRKKTWIDITHPDDVEVSHLNILKLQQSKANHIVYEKRYLHKNGRTIWGEISTSLLRGENDRALMFFSVVQDITQKKFEHQLLLENKERLKQAIEIADLGIWEWLAEDDRLILNSQMCTHLGISEQNFSGKGKDYPYLVIREGAIKESNHYTREVTIYRSDGSMAILQVTATMFYTATGVPEKAVGVCTDITRRKRTEEERNKREKLLYDTQKIGKIATFEMNLKTGQWSASPNLFELHDIEVPEKNDDSIWYHLLGEEHFLEISQQLLDACAQGNKTFNVSYSIARKSDGARRRFETRGEIFYDQSQLPDRLLSLTQDITEASEHLERIQLLQDKFSAAFDTTPDAISITRATDGFFIDVNPKFLELSGYCAEELEGKTSIEMNVWEDISDRNTVVQLLLEKGSVHNYEARFVHRDGTSFPGLISAGFLKIHDELCVLSIIKDITDRKKLENEFVLAKEKAEESEKLKTSFLTNMSHELRTPMIGILGYSEIIAEMSTDAETIKAASIISRSGHRLLNTLNLLLDISRLEAGTIILHNEDVDLVKILEDVTKDYRGKAEEKGLQLNIVAPLSSLNVVTDKSMIRSILENILDNAVKYTYTGEVRVFVNRMFVEDEVKAVLRITDTGIGIKESDLEKIWVEFRQASEGIGRSYEGVGLGLSITKRLIELVNGKISLTSEYGKGTVVTVYLPNRVM